MNLFRYEHGDGIYPAVAGVLEGESIDDDYYVPAADYAELETEVARLRAVLADIAKGEGAFNRDPYQHAANVIVNLVTLATKALTESPK